MNEKILLIDDEEEILDLLSRILKDEGYEICIAKDGFEGLAQFEKYQPDLIISDVKMPRDNGIDILKQLKNTGAEVDVIILTGHSDEATAIECLKLGAYDYLVKPLEDINILIKAVNRALEKKHLEKKNKELVAQLEELAIRDPLTGFYNHKQLEIYFDDEIMRSKRYGHSFCILIVDIDQLKGINQDYGFRFGDFVLKNAGLLLKDNLRKSDRIFRDVKEDFVLFLSETETMLPVVNKLMDVIRNHRFVWDDYETNVTISMGGSQFPLGAGNKTELVELAKNALYKAKAAGGNTFF
jgi:two-component system cell cycle response regulator